MKKLLVALYILILTSGTALAKWYDVGDETYIDSDKLKIKGNYVYIKYKYKNMDMVNKGLKNITSGVLIDKSYVSYFTADVIYDCKNPRSKTPLILLYGKDDNIITKVKDNTWDYDIDMESQKKLCAIFEKYR